MSASSRTARAVALPHISGWMDRTFYPRHEDNWDDQAFREEILRHLKPEHRILDVGAGAGHVRHMNFRGYVAHVAGVDPDPRVLSNPYLDSSAVALAERLPFDDDSFDLVFSDNVFEHLPNPAAALVEIARVLRPGGKILVKTPNMRHYIPMIARFSPMSIHRAVNRWRGRPAEHTFPTLYRANTHGTLGRLAGLAGLEVVRIVSIEGRPEYLRRFWPLYAAGLLFERTVNRFASLEPFRVVLIAVFSKRYSHA